MITVIKLGGNVCDDAPALATLQAAWQQRAADERWVLVHGGGTQIDQALNALDEPVLKVAGLRITSERVAGVVQETMDRVGADLAQHLRDLGLPAVHVPATERRLVATPKVLDGRPMDRVGTAVSFDAPALLARIPPGRIMVVTPTGWDDQGPLNVNADEGAVAVAASMHAERLLLATDVPGVRDAAGLVCTYLDATSVQGLLADGTAQGGMVPKLQNALQALDAGVGEVIIGGVGCIQDERSGTRLVPVAA